MYYRDKYTVAASSAWTMFLMSSVTDGQEWKTRTETETCMSYVTTCG